MQYFKLHLLPKLLNILLHKLICRFNTIAINPSKLCVCVCVCVCKLTKDSQLYMEMHKT